MLSSIHASRATANPFASPTIRPSAANYQRGLQNQLPGPAIRVVYSASGMYLAAAVLTGHMAVIEHKLYWAAAATLDEATYLTAVLNSNVLLQIVQPLQARGEHNPRDFDKYVWQAPIPV